MKDITELSGKDPDKVLRLIEEIREGKKHPLAKYVRPENKLVKKGFPPWMLMDEYALSYATPMEYGEHRARRINELFGMPVVDISCGVGGQLIALAQQGIECTGIEENPIRAMLAQINVNLARAKIKVHHADALGKKAIKAGEGKAILCDPFRTTEESYTPSFEEVLEAHNPNYLAYEFKPKEKVDELLKEHTALQHSTLEYYGSGMRCSRLTAYYGRGSEAVFYQNDANLKTTITYPLKSVGEARRNAQQKICKGMPKKKFILLNPCMIENYFASQLKAQVYQIDPKRYASQKTGQLESHKIFEPIVSSTSIGKIREALKRWETYAVKLRFPVENYWAFIEKHKLSTGSGTVNKFDLFKHGDTFYLTKEIATI